MIDKVREFDAIVSLRGWMAWWVVIGHGFLFIGGGREFLGWRLSTWAARVDLPVQVFMIVSGFVIAHLVLGKNEGYGQYVTRRWFRLVPLYVVAMALALASRGIYATAFHLNPFTPDTVARVERLALEQRYWLPYALGHITLLHGVVPDSLLKNSSSAFLAPAWSLSLEWQFYLVAPLLISGMTRTRYIAVPLIAIAVSLIAAFGLLGTWRYPSFLPLALPFFMIGITSRLILSRRWVAAALLTVASVVPYCIPHGVRWAIEDVCTAVAIWGLFLCLSLHEVGVLKLRSRFVDGLARLLALNPVIIMLGRISYSTYLCHIPIMMTVVGVAITIFGPTKIVTGVALLTSLPIIAGASHLLFNYVEKPGISYGAALVRRRKADDLAAA